MFSLSARLIVAVHRWGMITNDQDAEGAASLDQPLLNRPKGVTIASNYSMLYWREGILVTYPAGNFLVESFKDNVSISFRLYTAIKV